MCYFGRMVQIAYCLVYIIDLLLTLQTQVVLYDDIIYNVMTRTNKNGEYATSSVVGSHSVHFRRIVYIRMSV